MTPPGKAEAGRDAGAAVAPAVSVCPETGKSAGATKAALQRLRHRPDFLRAASARRQATPGFLLQARDRADARQGIRVGFTCSKKVGNAVARNRAKRRLREIARLDLATHGRPGWDYVLVGRREATATRDFALMREELRRALERVHG
ncbi:ribonuclease P protein component [Frigidibacter sp. ROC022]|uniref:ribonuclease P protein component n=1 Tax=Frigidibacter sp. ROC022 TaxID=2971796 RepID=UPI00215A54A0|nr:ribonuclease P protein component [Frigidibacter sp. ROC022]MCR8725925.1 ribonuclease P protein component [Frigidibacter sp. ROC022]